MIGVPDLRASMWESDEDYQKPTDIPWGIPGQPDPRLMEASMNDPRAQLMAALLQKQQPMMQQQPMMPPIPPGMMAPGGMQQGMQGMPQNLPGQQQIPISNNPQVPSALAQMFRR